MIAATNATINGLIICLCVALGVGFYTLLERNVLAYIQLRNGPNNAGFFGLPQPLADALKLFVNENPQVNSVNNMIYILSPIAALIVIFSLWVLYTSNYASTPFNLGIIFFLCVSSLNVYTVLLSGWSSNSKYALLGSVRAVAQTISYEVSMALVLITTLLASYSFNINEISYAQHAVWYAILIPPLAIMWFVSALAETNRAPFDLAEGESELVSGFNIEYGGGEFAFLFIAEYGSILLISLLTAALFIGGIISSSGVSTAANFLVVAYSFLWVRGTYPRMRYDTLMSLTWKSFLTVVLSFLIIWTPIICQ